MSESPGAPPVVAGSANCLIVDDEPSVRRSLVRMLQAQGFTCFEAGSGREALGVLERIGEAPLVISDMRMPELDGVGLLDRGAPALPGHLGDHAHRHERNDHRGRLPPPGRRRLPAQADLGERAAGAGRAGAREARPGAAEPVLSGATSSVRCTSRPSGSRSSSCRASRCSPARSRPRTPTPAGTRSGSASTRWAPPAASASTARASTAFGWAGSCTTSARSGPARPCCTSRGRSRTTSSARSASIPRWASGCCSPLAQESPDVLRIVRSHHERLDGRGFPDGLRGEKIPIEARIVAVADAFDAMTTERPVPRFPATRCRHGRAPPRRRHPARSRGGRGLRRRVSRSEPSCRSRPSRRQSRTPLPHPACLSSLANGRPPESRILARAAAASR